MDVYLYAVSMRSSRLPTRTDESLAELPVHGIHPPHSPSPVIRGVGPKVDLVVTGVHGLGHSIGVEKVLIPIHGSPRVSGTVQRHLALQNGSRQAAHEHGAARAGTGSGPASHGRREGFGSHGDWLLAEGVFLVVRGRDELAVGHPGVASTGGHLRREHVQGQVAAVVAAAVAAAVHGEPVAAVVAVAGPGAVGAERGGGLRRLAHVAQLSRGHGPSSGAGRGDHPSLLSGRVHEPVLHR